MATPEIRTKLAMGEVKDVVTERIQKALDTASFEFLKAHEFGLVSIPEIKAISVQLQQLRHALEIVKNYR